MNKVLKFVLSRIVPAIFKAEAGSPNGGGAEKLNEVLTEVSKDITIGIDNLSKLNPAALASALTEVINATVELLNAIGVLDNKPGLDIDVFDIKAGFRFVKAIQGLVEVFG